MKYKVGDRVRIKSLDWYNENKDENGNIRYKHGNVYPIFFTKYMSRFCGETVTIKCVHTRSYHMNETGYCEFWTDEMIEGLVDEEIKNWADVSIPDDPFTVTYGSPSMNDSMNKNNIDNGIIILPEGYIFKDENGNVINATKIVLEKKKKEYPKTYEECIGKLPINWDNKVEGYKSEMLNSFQKLIICRDAYWKIAGEKMGLGKPWEPNDSSGYCTYAILRHTGHIRKSRPYADSELLEFPTEEMRDAFYENFKELIEQCKELL